jgi:hypothetical protein
MMLLIGALCELLRYDVLNALAGFHSIERGMPAVRRIGRNVPRNVEKDVARAIAQAASFYWKAPRCLQESVVAARMLRKRGIDAKVVIGYQPMPFLSHAWVEIEGRFFGGGNLQQALIPLHRF